MDHERKPLKIIPLGSLGGISFEISSLKDPHDLRLVTRSLLCKGEVMHFSSRRYLFEIPLGIIMTEYSEFMPVDPYQSSPWLRKPRNVRSSASSVVDIALKRNALPDYKLLIVQVALDTRCWMLKRKDVTPVMDVCAGRYIRCIARVLIIGGVLLLGY